LHQKLNNYAKKIINKILISEIKAETLTIFISAQFYKNDSCFKW